MAKISQVHNTLLIKREQEQRQFELEARKSLEDHLQRLEAHSTKSYNETLKRIEKTMTQRNSETVERLERKLSWLGWERWVYVVLAFLIGAILSPYFLYFQRGETINYNDGSWKKVIVIKHQHPATTKE
jgi:predicted RND superfamily exporter protein